MCQALLNAVIGFAIAALIGTAVAHFTAKGALQIVITPYLMIELFLLTVVMCVTSAIAALLRVVRVDPAIVLTQ
jgi:putative ABC transport system permease protein